MTTLKSTDTHAVNPPLSFEAFHEEFVREEKQLKVQVLSFLIAELSGQPDTDSAQDKITLMQMALEEMTVKGIKSQPAKIAYLQEKLAKEVS